jgi:membrane protease YdiL (CAAX protease family)
MEDRVRRSVQPQDRGRVALELLWVSLGVGLMADLAMRQGWLGFAGPVAELDAWQLLALLLLQNLLALASIMVFLRLDGQSLSYLGFRKGRNLREVRLGLLLFPVVLIGALGLQTVLLRYLPGLHNVDVNPILAMLHGPEDLAALLAASVLAGGVAEEIVRAFVLRRFQTHLGGIGVGLVVWGLAFGAMHLSQGYDKALVVGLLGLLFGLLYVWRRSPVAAMVVHGAFNVAQTLAAYFLVAR